MSTESINSKLALLFFGAVLASISSIITSIILKPDYVITKSLKVEDILSPIRHMFYVKQNAKFNLKATFSTNLYLKKDTDADMVIKAQITTFENKSVSMDCQEDQKYKLGSSEKDYDQKIVAKTDCKASLSSGVYYLEVTGENRGGCQIDKDYSRRCAMAVEATYLIVDDDM